MEGQQPAGVALTEARDLLLEKEEGWTDMGEKKENTPCLRTGTV